MLLIAGPCVIESEDQVFEVAEHMKALSEKYSLEFYFKASFDKANRSSTKSFRGPGVEQGLKILARVKSDLGLKILTDVHEDSPIEEVASVVDVMQTPAFLVRQTNFIQRVARAGIPVNIKKGQFQAPWDMVQVVKKCHEVGNNNIWLCERGTCFGYNTLISDMRGLAVMRQTGCKIIFDATHSVQEPGGLGAVSGGQREMVPVLARAAVAAGVDGVFLETHPNPNEALSDGPNMIPLAHMEELIETLLDIDAVVKNHGYLEARI